jgi:hypothetical protein
MCSDTSKRAVFTGRVFDDIVLKKIVTFFSYWFFLVTIIITILFIKGHVYIDIGTGWHGWW